MRPQADKSNVVTTTTTTTATLMRGSLVSSSGSEHPVLLVEQDKTRTGALEIDQSVVGASKVS